MRLVALLFLSSFLLTGCAVVESPAPAEVAQNSSQNQSEPTAEPEPTQEPEPVMTLAELQELVRAVPDQNLESLKQHFLMIDDAAKSLEPFQIDYQIGPTAVPEKVDIVVSMFSEKLKMYQLVGLDSLNQDWVLASEKDYDWWVEYRLTQDPDFPVELWNSELNELGHCGLSSNVFCGAGNTVNGKNYQDNVVGTRFTDRGLNYVSRHEAAHFYQAVFGYGGRCWFAEGQATFFETYLERTSRSRSQVIQDLVRSPSKVADASEQELIELMENDMVCTPDYRVAYDLGMLAFEYLYTNFSFVEVHDLMVRSSEIAWDEAVAEILKVDPTELNQAMSSYIFSQIP